MMTASSVEFFPCRVQLMGLPRSASTSSTATSLVNHNETANLQTAPNRPQLATIRGVSRNLFGAPDPQEINNIYQQEAERRRSYILQRYNFDIKTTKPTSKQNARQPTDSVNTASTTNKNTQLPTLIEQELKQHEQRLQTEQLNLNRSSDTILSKTKILNDSCSGGSKIMRGCSEESLTTFASERQKPYSRQSLLTDNYNLRKNNISWTSYCKKTNAVKLITLKSGLHSHRNLEVLQLPQALQAHEEEPPSDLKEQEDHKNATTTANVDDKCVVDDSPSSSSSSSSGCSSNNCTALSLKVVVSSQDISSTTTSDASNAHTHQA